MCYVICVFIWLAATSSVEFVEKWQQNNNTIRSTKLQYEIGGDGQPAIHLGLYPCYTKLVENSIGYLNQRATVAGWASYLYSRYLYQLYMFYQLWLMLT